MACRRSPKAANDSGRGGQQGSGIRAAYSPSTMRARRRSYADIDRFKAEKVGLTPTDVFSTLQLYLGSQYVNDFNYLGRTYPVYRRRPTSSSAETPEDIARLKVRNAAGEMVPIGSVATFAQRDHALPRAALQPLPRGRDHGRALGRASPRARPSREWRSSPARCSRRASRYEWTELSSPAEAAGHAHASSIFAAAGAVRLPRARRTV